jgi:hypothetical protein
MLCADGAKGGSRKGLKRAIFAYNHAHWYVRDVLAIAARYTVAAARLAKHARQHRSRRHRRLGRRGRGRGRAGHRRRG